MADRILSLRFADIIEAIDNIRSILDGASLNAFEGDWQKRWLVERGLEIISEASRHLPKTVKAAHPRDSVGESSRDRQRPASLLRPDSARYPVETGTGRLIHAL
jgi:hypothetical protein